MITEPDDTVDVLAKLLTLYDTNPLSFLPGDSKVLLRISDERIDNTFSSKDKRELERLWDEYAAV